MGKLINTDDIPWDVEGVGFIPVIGKDEIDAMPEGVVRCKDCRRSSVEYTTDGGVWKTDDKHLFCKLTKHLMRVDDFCSWGERREDDIC